MQTLQEKFKNSKIEGKKLSAIKGGEYPPHKPQKLDSVEECVAYWDGDAAGASACCRNAGFSC